MVAIQLVDIGLATHVEPRIETHGRLKIAVDRSNARHLAIKGQARDTSGIDAAQFNALPYGGGGRAIEISHVLLHRARLRIVQRNLDARFGDAHTIQTEQCRLGGGGAEVDAQ